MIPELFEEIKSRMPADELLELAAPMHIWHMAAKQAKRSDHKRHKTGCVIYGNNQTLATGCSHTHGGGLKIRSIHAEMHALTRLYIPLRHRVTLRAVVVTLTKVNNFASISKPCSTCAQSLTGIVDEVSFVEKANDGSWQVLTVSPDSLTGARSARYGHA